MSDQHNPFDKSELAKALALKMDWKLMEAKESIDFVFEQIQTALADGRRVELHEIGSFHLKAKAARKGHVPDGIADGMQDGAEWETPARLKVSFRAYDAFSGPIGEKMGTPTY